MKFGMFHGEMQLETESFVESRNANDIFVWDTVLELRVNFSKLSFDGSCSSITCWHIYCDWFILRNQVKKWGGKFLVPNEKKLSKIKGDSEAWEKKRAK